MGGMWWGLLLADDPARTCSPSGRRAAVRLLEIGGRAPRSPFAPAAWCGGCARLDRGRSPIATVSPAVAGTLPVGGSGVPDRYVNVVVAGFAPLAAVTVPRVPPCGGGARSDRTARAAAPSAPQPEARDDGAVALDVAAVEVVEQATAPADHLEQAAARRVVLGMVAQVLGEPPDAFAQNGDLHLRRARVGLVLAVLLDDLGLGADVGHWDDFPKAATSPETPTGPGAGAGPPPPPAPPPAPTRRKPRRH